ncbi:MAG: efflux RND transporter periplasmic adaptor subunit [Actinomycetota bacterium]
MAIGTQHGGGAPSSPGKLVKAERGVVDTTVGGIGHITTLTGAALLSVPSSSSGAAGAGAASAGGAASTGSSVSGSSVSAGAAGGTGSSASAASSSGGAATPAPADAVFPTVTGHVTRLLVHEGDQVSPGQPIARVSDDGTIAGGVLQARNDLGTARLELAQKRVRDPLLGPPPTAAEVQAGDQAVITARTALRGLQGPPLAADVAAARSELARAVADLHSSRASPLAMTAAEIAVATAQQNLQTLAGAPDPAELAAAQLEVAKAILEQQSLSPTPTAAESTAAQLAVTAAQQKLDQLIHPLPSLVSAAQGELAKAKLDLAALRATRQGTGLSALRAAVRAASTRLHQLRPTADVIATAQSDVRKAQADLAILRQRGAPASAIDLALARLFVVVSRQRLGLAQHLAGELTVRARSTGTVTSLLTTPGAAVDPATPLMRVQDLGNLVVALDLSEFDVGHVRVGELTRVSVDALGGRTYKGRVIDLAPTGTDVGGVVNFPVIIALQSTGGGSSSVRPGMSVSARIVTQIRRDVVHIPSAAVSGAGQPEVTVRGPSGALTTRPVRLGLEGPQLVEVRSGLQPGARVLIPAGNQG